MTNRGRRRDGRHPRHGLSKHALTVFVSWLLLGSSATAMDDWNPPIPDADNWDWLQLDTFEWVKGELIVFQNDEAEFDSDKFDELEIDLEDIVVLRLAKPRIFRRSGRRTYVGIGELHDGMMA